MLERIPHPIGRALRPVRSGLESLAIHDEGLGAAVRRLELRSPAFGDGQRLPVLYTQDGAGVSPPLRWGRLPPATRALLLMIEDPDAPAPGPFVHAIVCNLSPFDAELPEGHLSDGNATETLVFGKNSYLDNSFLPPDPPPGHGAHRYAFELFALDRPLSFDEPPGRRDVLHAMRGHVLAKGCLTGVYERV